MKKYDWKIDLTPSERKEFDESLSVYKTGRDVHARIRNKLRLRCKRRRLKREAEKK